MPMIDQICLRGCHIILLVEIVLIQIYCNTDPGEMT